MNKNDNKIVIIQGSEFIVDEDAEKILHAHIKSISARYRLNPKVKRELLNALRDLLAELPAKKQKTIDKETSLGIISMAGGDYENESAIEPIRRNARKSIKLIVEKARKYVLTESVRRNIFYILSIIMLVPIGLGIGTLDYFTKDLYDYSLNPSAQIIDTTLGPVKQYDGAYDRSKYEVDTPAPKQYTAISIIIVTMLFSILFYALAKRSNKVRFIIALLVVAIVSSWTISDNENRAFGIAMTSWSKNSPEVFAPNPPRSENNLDTLYACGAEIRYVFLDGSDGIFYTLLDAGYPLNTVLNGNPEPTNDTLCMAYDNLRKQYSNDRIVLMPFIEEADGTIRPFDYANTMSQKVLSQRLAKYRYGFFVNTTR